MSTWVGPLYAQAILPRRGGIAVCQCQGFLRCTAASPTGSPVESVATPRHHRAETRSAAADQCAPSLRAQALSTRPPMGRPGAQPQDAAPITPLLDGWQRRSDGGNGSALVRVRRAGPLKCEEEAREGRKRHGARLCHPCQQRRALRCSNRRYVRYRLGSTGRLSTLA